MTKKLTKKQMRERSRKGREARLAKKEASLADMAREGCINVFQALDNGYDKDSFEVISFAREFGKKVRNLRPYQQEKVVLMMGALSDVVLAKEELGQLATLKEKIDLIKSHRIPGVL